MQKIIVANWKLNPTTQKEAEQLFDAVKKGIKRSKAEVVICPPFVYLSSFKFSASAKASAGKQDSSFKLGAQDVFYEDKGAFTGEVSAAQLKDLEVGYVILGHSERRKYFSETDETINKKIIKSLAAGLKVIFCVGEKEGEDRDLVLEKQITEGLKKLSPLNFKLSNLVIAYEPVWAIGTGNNCSTDQVMGTVVLVRKIISNLYNVKLAETVKILYGGSVNSKNSQDYIKNGGVDGLLVGGASLDAKEFVNIIKSAE